MKKKYVIPCVEIVKVTAHVHILESSFIDTGGKGSFDVQEYNMNIWPEENEE